MQLEILFYELHQYLMKKKSKKRQGKESYEKGHHYEKSVYDYIDGKNQLIRDKTDYCIEQNRDKQDGEKDISFSYKLPNGFQHKAIIECKKWNCKKVGEPEVRLLESKMRDKRVCSGAIYFDGKGVSKNAINKANEYGIDLVNFHDATGEACIGDIERVIGYLNIIYLFVKDINNVLNVQPHSKLSIALKCEDFFSGIQDDSFVETNTHTYRDKILVECEKIAKNSVSYKNIEDKMKTDRSPEEIVIKSKFFVKDISNFDFAGILSSGESIKINELFGVKVKICGVMHMDDKCKWEISTKKEDGTKVILATSGNYLKKQKN